jgi:hypothetical protein
MLGHDLPFSYCRQPGRDVPCGRIYDCWWEKLDIAAFMEANYAPEIIAAVLQPKPAKVLSLLEIIEKARKQSSQEGSK